MSTSSKRFARTTAIFLLIGMAALAVIVGLTIWLVQQNQTYFDDVVEARTARSAAVDLQIAVLEMESGQRGYLLTGNELYLEGYYIGTEEMMPRYELLREVAASFPQASALPRLREMLDIKLAEVARSIELHRQGDIEGAVALVQTDRGKQLMDEARILFSAIIDTANRRLAEGADRMRIITDALWWTTLAGAVVILAVVGGAIGVVLRYTRELIAARGEVEALNAGLEARIEERTQDLIRANEEVQRFAYIVTHDLRAPLVNIMGFTSELDTTMESIQAYVMADGETLSADEIQQARTAASEDLPEAIGFIRSSTRKMDALINAILKISRDGRRPLKPERIDLQTMIAQNADALQHQVAETEGRIDVDIALPAIRSDRLSLEQIFGNLLDNAVKYRAPDRPIEIDVTARELPGRRIAVDVKDNGRGIAAQDHQRVFDLFRRSGSQDTQGEGIGLAHVRTLVRNLGGDITMQSEIGRGTVFQVILPKDLAAVKGSTEK